MPIHRLFINFILPEIVVKEQTDRHRQNGTEESDQQIYVKRSSVSNIVHLNNLNSG